MRAFGSDLLKENIELKEHNTIQADRIANLNSYITQFQSSTSTNHYANTLSITTIYHCE